MAEGHIEVSPPLRHGVGNLEGKWPFSGDTAGICDGAWGRVVSVALGNARSIDEQAQEAPTIAAGVEDPPPLRPVSMVSRIAFQMKPCSSCMASSSAAPRQ